MYAPFGNLGLFFSKLYKDDYATVVEVRDCSAFKDQIFIGDKVFAINNVKIKPNSKIEDFIMVLKSKQSHPKRKLTVV